MNGSERLGNQCGARGWRMDQRGVLRSYNAGSSLKTLSCLISTQRLTSVAGNGFPGLLSQQQRVHLMCRADVWMFALQLRRGACFPTPASFLRTHTSANAVTTARSLPSGEVISLVCTIISTDNLVPLPPHTHTLLRPQSLFSRLKLIKYPSAGTNPRQLFV